MASRKYTVGRPTQEVRLKDWPAGQVAQFKRAIEMLETELNTTMASQIEQGVKRVVSARVPRVTGLTVTAGFKNFQINFNEAKGINDILFYEIQKDNFANFKNPTTYNTPQTTLTIPTAEEREVIYIRVRVMNSKFQVGPWSATISVTGSGDFRISTTKGERTTLNIASADFDTWVDVQSLSISVGASALSVNIQPGVVERIDTDLPSGSVYTASSSSHGVTFRLMKNGVEVTNAGKAYVAPFATYVYQPEAEEMNEEEQKVEKAEFGVIISPLETCVNTTLTYTLQAYVNSEISSSTDALIIVDTFEILEIVQAT